MYVTVKVVAFVTDSSPHVSAAVQLAGWRSLPCFANMLNVMAQEALKEVYTRTAHGLAFGCRDAHTDSIDSHFSMSA